MLHVEYKFSICCLEWWSLLVLLDMCAMLQNKKLAIRLCRSPSTWRSGAGGVSMTEWCDTDMQKISRFDTIGLLYQMEERRPPSCYGFV